MTICRKCGTSNQDGKKFCVFCHELLIADPVELEKRAVAAQKKQNKELKKLNAKHKRWKRAPFLLIPIGLLDFLDLLLCLDLAFIGVGNAVGGLIGDIASGMLGNIISLFGNDVYTDQTVEHIVRALEFLGALGLLLLACVLSVVMIVRMIKWRKYRKNGDKKEEELHRAMESAQAEQGASAASTPAQQEVVQEVVTAMDAESVSYASLAQLEAQKQAYIMPEPENETDVAHLFGALRAHLWEYSEDSVRRILSAMSASRLLLCSAGAMDSAGFFEHLAHALGVPAEQLVCEAAKPGEGGIARVLLQRDAQSGAAVHSAFAGALYTARFSPRNVCLAGVSGIDAASVDDVFAPFSPYFSVPEGQLSLYLGQPAAQSGKLPEGIDGGMLVLPCNLWLLNVLPEHDRAPVLQGAAARYAATVYLQNSGKAFPPEDAETAQPVTVSVDALERAVAAAEGAYYLSDELWGVIDLVEQRVIEAGGEKLSNRTLRMLEKYTAVFLASGGKMADAFDNGFACVILPAYGEQLKVLVQQTEGESLSALLERTVGKEKLPMTTEVLSSMNLI